MVALTEAKRCLVKLPEDMMTRKAMDTIEKRISTVHHFLRARRSFDNGSLSDGMGQCRQLLSQLVGSDAPVRAGDVYALMLENERDLSNARKLYVYRIVWIMSVKKSIFVETLILLPDWSQ